MNGKNSCDKHVTHVTEGKKTGMCHMFMAMSSHMKIWRPNALERYFKTACHMKKKPSCDSFDPL